LNEEKESYISAVRSLSIWPETVGIEEGKKKEKSFPKINLRC